jgi:hypothetical protein
MSSGPVKVWIDPEGGFLEVVLEAKEGKFEYDESGTVNVKRDSEGNVIAFHILGLKKMEGTPFEVELRPHKPEKAR